MSVKSIFKTAGRLCLFAALFLTMAGCGLSDPFYIRVALIEGVPETGEAGTPLTLTATVRPDFASNKNIVWLIKNAGTTEASINGNILYTAAGGIVTIRAIIANGIAEGKEYTQDFKIVFTAGETAPNTYTVTFETNGGGDIAPQSVVEGQTAQKPDNPVKPGFDFVNWYDNEDLTDPPYNFDTPVTADITLYAYWIVHGTAVPDYDSIFYNIADIKAWLDAQPANTADNPYRIALNVDDLGGTGGHSGSVGASLRKNSDKYVSLDLSGSTITSIGHSAFESCTNLTGITIPDSVTSIGEWVFDWCTSLTAITVDSGNKNYTSDQGVLYNKNKTTLIQYPAGKADVSFTIPNSVTNIGEHAFFYCASLTGITIPDSVKSIGSQAFSGCSFTSVTIPNSVNSIGIYAFSQCTSLTDVTIGNGVTRIEQGAFSECTSLKNVTIPNSVNSIGMDAFYYCFSLTGVTIPNSVTSIEELAFAGCTSLAGVTIPDSVNSIRGQAFAACTSLTSVTFEGTITSNGLDSKAFGDSGPAYIGDLRDKYLAADGGIGTYTRPDTSSTTWTKKP